MNERMDKVPAGAEAEAAVNNKRQSTPRRAAWLKKRNRSLSLIKCGIVGAFGMILVLGALLLLLPCFRVQSIEVKGNTFTTEAEILSAAQISIGTEMIGTNWQEVVSRIEAGCPVRVTLKLGLSKVTIEVTELEAMCFEYGNRWFSVDNELKVLTSAGSREDFDGLLEVKLPPLAYLCIGEKLTFADGEIDRSYICSMLELFREQGITDRVERLDVSEKYNVSYVLDGSLRIVLGQVKELEEKLDLVNEILDRRAVVDDYAVVDVSNIKKTVYRPLSSGDLLLAD
ncbi:MAG: FtsQ-type POTRA domain-containing protein [Ruminococcaceae bacterium]|nr:FtsQ-type POTRA domain-containing protein [Oscillospiraceae bacterium]